MVTCERLSNPRTDTGGSGEVVDKRQGALVFHPHPLEGGLITADRVEGGFVAEEVRRGRSNPLFLKFPPRAKFCFRKMKMLEKLVP